MSSDNRWRYKPLLIVLLVTFILGTVGVVYFVYLKPPQSLIIVYGDNLVMLGSFTMTRQLTDEGFTPQPVIEPGQLILFRTTRSTKWGSGIEGKVYRLNKEFELKEIGDFDVNKSNGQIAKQYGIPFERYEEGKRVK